jgi:predicted dehydrogenase
MGDIPSRPSIGIPGDFTPVVVGYGRAGRLHHRCLSAVAGDHVDVVIVDPVRPAQLAPKTRWLPTVRDALETVDPNLAVFHVTTPVRAHISTTKRLAAAGAQHIILEKPMAETREDAYQVTALARAGVQLIPVAVWPASVVTQQVKRIITDGAIGDIVAIRFEQSKPRFGQSRHDLAHTSAFQVELPHQILLALHLAGPVAAVQDVVRWPLTYPDGSSLRDRGGVKLTLVHRSGIRCVLVSDLCSPVRMRRLQVRGVRELIAHFPIGDDQVGHVRMPGGRWTVVHDAPLTQFISSAYLSFAKAPDTLGVDLSMHLQTMEILETAINSAVGLARDEAIDAW